MPAAIARAQSAVMTVFVTFSLTKNDSAAAMMTLRLLLWGFKHRNVAVFPGVLPRFLLSAQDLFSLGPVYSVQGARVFGFSGVGTQ